MAADPVVELLREARLARRMTVPVAAAAAGISQQNWSRIEQGKATTIPPSTLAHMAGAVGVTADELDALGEAKAARILARIELDRERRQPQGEIEDYFTNTAIPIEERKRKALRFMELLPYLMRGEEPPAPSPPAEAGEEQRRQDQA